MVRWLAVSMIMLTLAGCGSGGDDPEASEESTGPKTFTARGTFDLTAYSGIAGGKRNCFGKYGSGYDDLVAGAQVVIRDSKGEKVAIGQLSKGYLSDGNCQFDFEVADIPDEGTIFTVEITHRGEVSFKRNDATSLALTIG